MFEICAGERFAIALRVLSCLSPAKLHQSPPLPSVLAYCTPAQNAAITLVKQTGLQGSSVLRYGTNCLVRVWS